MHKLRTLYPEGVNIETVNTKVFSTKSLNTFVVV